MRLTSQLDHAPPRPRPRRRRAVLGRPSVAALAVAVVVAGAGTAAAHDWLPVLETERLAPVGFSPADLVALPDLGAYGDVVLIDEVVLRPVADAAAAAAATGLDVPEVPSLPRGISGEPTYQVGARASATITFSATRIGHAPGATSLPPGLDGSQVRLQAGPGVLVTWSRSAGVPLVVGRAVAPTASSSGASFAAIRAYLLSLPGLPGEAAAQLRTFDADGSTLPLPVPTDRITTSTAQVHGATATVLATRDRTLAAVVWVDDGVLTAVAGALSTDEVLAIARGLR